MINRKLAHQMALVLMLAYIIGAWFVPKTTCNYQSHSFAERAAVGCFGYDFEAG